MLLGILGARLLVNLLTGKWVVRSCEGRIRAGKRTIRTDQGF